MSFKRGMAALNLEYTDKIPRMEFFDHDEMIKKLTGIDSRDTERQKDIGPAIAKALDYDYIWSIYEMPVAKGRITKMGHAVWNNIDGQDNELICPFTNEDEVLDFDPVEEYGIPDRKLMVEEFGRNYRDGQFANYTDAVFPGGRYHSIFSACIRTFGWDMFLSSAGYDYDRFDRVLEGFYRITKAEIEAWIDVGIKVFNMHDDICWSSGPAFHPEWYRKYIFPRYKKLWEPLKEAGIKVIYTSDGAVSIFIDDLFEAGADGLVIEPSTSLEYIVEKYGKTKIVMGNIDCRILQFGTKDDIYNEVKRCVELGKKCPGYFYSVSNHIPNGIPLENIDYYLEITEKLGKR